MKISRFKKAPVEVSSNRINPIENPINTLNLPEKRLHVGKKAQDLARDETSIVKVPGSENTWMIKSYSNKQPHYVRLSNSAGISCDDQCLSYKSLKICSHTSVALAAKENFISKLLKWYQTQKVASNYTALSESGKLRQRRKYHIRVLLKSSLNRS